MRFGRAEAPLSSVKDVSLYFQRYNKRAKRITTSPRDIGKI
jgi:hypothetical protein